MQLFFIEDTIEGDDITGPAPNLSCQWLPTIQQHTVCWRIRVAVADVLSAAGVHADLPKSYELRKFLSSKTPKHMEGVVAVAVVKVCHPALRKMSSAMT